MHGEQNLPDPNADLFVSYIDDREMNQRKNPLTAVRVLGRSVYSVEARQKFASLLDRVKPDMVHLQNIHAHITPSVIFEAKRRNIPVVWTLHDYKLICPNSHFLIDQTGQICEACRGGRFWQAAAKRCKKGSLPASALASLEAYGHQLMGVRGMVDAFLCPSAFLRGKLLENGYTESNTHHIPLFLPADAFEPIGEDDGYLLFLGKLERLKGIYCLIEAARKSPNVQIVLAGRVEEPLLGQLPELLPSNVKYVGFKSGDELTALRRRARAFVLPSQWYENQPFSILEAFALGKPVIASDLGGMRELVGANERGLLVPAGDIDQLTQAMRWIAANPAGARQLGEKAFSYVMEKHSPENHYQLISDLYRNLQR
jgi:glycosyltransferase involved in cell wall biosynthesis